ncbi:DUF3299 domain-containing protein [Endozoicomonas sp. G2_1]|nr:DUF3299 domain-containing protein [Endozoicomonas sp. G2_1]
MVDETLAYIDRQQSLKLSQYETIEWTALIPEQDLQALLNPPSYLDEIADGSLEDQIYSQIQNAVEPEQTSEEESRYQSALISTDTMKAFDGKQVRIPGFVVPLEFSGEKTVTSFFLVPYFGACIHSPPPPPNQIVFVEIEQGIVLESLYEPVWLLGRLSTELFEDPMATSAYTMQLQHIEYYLDIQ